MCSFLGQLHKDRLLPMLLWILCFFYVGSDSWSRSCNLHWGGVYSLHTNGFQTNQQEFLVTRALNKAEMASNLNHFPLADEILFTAMQIKSISLYWLSKHLLLVKEKGITYFLSLLFLDIFARFGQIALKTCWKSVQFLLRWVSSFLAQFNEVEFIAVCLPSDMR